MSNLLINEQPLLVLPQLAAKIGLNESIILQQVHFWLEIKRKADTRRQETRDGRYWIYNTYIEWQEQFPFWSVSTIRRAIGNLEGSELLLSTSDYNRSDIDKTKWYSIDYEKLAEFEADMGKGDGIDSTVHNEQSIDQIEQSSCPIWTDGQPILDKAIPETTTETTTERKDNNLRHSFPPDSIEFILACELRKKILENNSKARLPDDDKLQKWARDFDKMIRIDNRTEVEIRQVISFSQSDSFWKCNILSTSKLREKFDTLMLQSIERAKKGKMGQYGTQVPQHANYKQREYDDDYFDKLYENG